MQTLLQYAAGTDGDNRDAAELFAMNGDLLAALPFDTIGELSLPWEQEGALPGAAFRKIGAEYVESHGVINPQVEHLKIAGGDIDTDYVLTQTTRGASRWAQQRLLKTKALAQALHYALIEGDADAGSGFHGLKRRCPVTSARSLDNGSGGSAMSVKKLDEAIDSTLNPTHLLMNFASARNFKAYARTLVGVAEPEQTALGRPVETYRGLPILIADRHPGLASTPLQFDDATLDPTAGANTTSVFVLSVGGMGYHGVQLAPMNVESIGRVSGTNTVRMKIEWVCSHLLKTPFAIRRLYNITNATAAA